MISLEEYLMGRDRQFSLTVELLRNASNLLCKVNYLLGKLGKEGKVNSGWRPAQINLRAGGKLLSAHITCEAIDLEDKDSSLAKAIIQSNLLEELDLYMEDPTQTAGWLHLQTRKTKSGKRIFLP